MYRKILESKREYDTFYTRRESQKAKVFGPQRESSLTREYTVIRSEIKDRNLTLPTLNCFNFHTIAQGWKKRFKKLKGGWE